MNSVANQTGVALPADRARSAARWWQVFCTGRAGVNPDVRYFDPETFKRPHPEQ